MSEMQSAVLRVGSERGVFGWQKVRHLLWTPLIVHASGNEYGRLVSIAKPRSELGRRAHAKFGCLSSYTVVGSTTCWPTPNNHELGVSATYDGWRAAPDHHRTTSSAQAIYSVHPYCTQRRP